MLKDELDRIRREFKDKALALRNRGEYGRALAALDTAIAELKALKPDDESEVRDIRAETADILGVKGGIYRRSNMDAEALEQYRAGAELEEKDSRSTYNISNVITLGITQGKQRPDDPEVERQIDRVIEDLVAQTQGARQDEWWAWFDLGQFYLLRNKPREALRCYERAISTGPPTHNIERHIEILEDLRKAVASSEVSAAIRVAEHFLEQHV